MNIYHFNAATGLLIGPGRADQDPLDQNNWLVPACATTAEPLAAAAGKTVNFISGAWRHVDIPAATPSAPVPAPTLEEVVASYEAAVQAHLDAFAATWRYESILSAASYANSTVPSFKAEALALIAWRDQVWAQCYTELAAVQVGTQPMPVSPAAFVATLPASPARP